MFELRDYQQKAVNKGIWYFNEATGKHAAPSVEVLPTGAGKSLVIANIVKELQGSTIVFQPSMEILLQNYGKLKSYGVDNIGIYSASVGQKEVGNVTYATIGSVANNMELFKHVKNVIVDECHGVAPEGGQYKTFFNYIGAKKVLGLTATPYRLKSYLDPFTGQKFSQVNLLCRTRPKFFSRIIHITQIQELLDAGYLCPLSYTTDNDFDHTKIRLNSTGADYNEASLRNYMLEEYGIIERVVMAVKHAIGAGQKHILVFNTLVCEAEQLALELRRHGISAAMVCGDISKTPKKERAAILESFQDGYIKVVCNVGVLTTGFDFPALDTIILARPTMSLALYYQMVGRVFRIHEEKERGVIYDLAGNVKLFGKVENFVTEFSHSHKGYITISDKGVLTGRRLDEIRNGGQQIGLGY